MNEIVTNTANLPANLEDLSRFVLVGREKLTAVRAEIRAIKKVGLAREVAEQKRQEAQQLAEAVIDAEVRIGELMREIPTAQGARTDTELSQSALTKFETLKENGFSKQIGNQFEQMSKHPEAVAAAKAEAREAEEIVTRSAVLDKIKEENAALKRRVRELEQTPPQVVTQTVEVVPEDYEQTKKALEDAKYTAARAEKDLQTMRQKYETARDNAEHLAQKIGESTEAAKAERDIQYFTTATHDYIRRYGGHVWAFNEIQNVSETVRGDYIKAIKALDAFAQQMITNIEGGLK
jgi:predicted O-linked N-acetylglucosamine transferase (SPINDLY family)